MNAQQSSGPAASSNMAAILAMSHIHIGVKNYDETRQWFSRVLGWEPSLQKSTFCYYDLPNVRLVIERMNVDVPVTLALRTESCDVLCEELQSSGADLISPPTGYPWGTRTAYLRGPGGITLEIEEEKESV